MTDVLKVFHDAELNMHVVRQLGEDELASQKPGVRAIIAERLELIYQSCAPWIGQADGGDGTRVLELALRTLDRLAKVYEIYEPDRPGTSSETVIANTRQRQEAVLAELAERAGGAS